MALPDRLPPLRLTTAVEGAFVWLLDLRHEPNVDVWQACQPNEHARAARFRLTLHARRYRAAHGGMRMILAAHLGLAMQAWAWQASEHGKPHFVDARHGHFNLSHSEDWALLAWHSDVPLGVDIEWHRTLPDLDGLARHYFTSAEQSWLNEAVTASHREMRFHRLWSAKEAALKALGSGLLVAPRRVEVDWRHGSCVTQIDLGPADARAARSRCRLTVTEVALPEWLRAQAALAVVAPGDQSECW